MELVVGHNKSEQRLSEKSSFMQKLVSKKSLFQQTLPECRSPAPCLRHKPLRKTCLKLMQQVSCLPLLEKLFFKSKLNSYFCFLPTNLHLNTLSACCGNVVNITRATNQNTVTVQPMTGNVCLLISTR